MLRWEPVGLRRRAGFGVVMDKWIVDVGRGGGRGRCRHPTRRAFTLIEMLAVLGVTAVLMLLLIPAVQRSMRQASSTVCMHQLKEINRALQEYRLDNRGWLPDVEEPSVDGPIDAHGAAWYGRLVPRYLGNPSTLVCPADPARKTLSGAKSLDEQLDPANASSYGMNSVIHVAGLGALDRGGPANPLETILLADMGPDLVAGGAVFRNDGWLPWDDAYHPALTGLRDSWLTGRHFGHINVLTVGGAVQRVRTTEMLEGRISNYYSDCAAGGCPLCLDYQLAHYSFASDRLYWWTGAIHASD